MRLDKERAPWCSRVVASDASPGGHGLAYTWVPTAESRVWATYAAHRGDYLCLDERYEHLAMSEQPRDHLRLASLPLGPFRWRTVARPGGMRHIVLEECAAHVWATESHLHYPEELGCRCVHLGDNAAQVGSHNKGRSSRRRVNHYCRKECAIEVSGGLDVFELYVPSGEKIE